MTTSIRGVDHVSGEPADSRQLGEAMRALGLSADAVIEPAAGGASGSAWMVRTATESYVLRLSASVRLADTRLAAMAAARNAGLPAPDLIRRAGEAVLLSWLPGISLLEALVAVPADARRWGRLIGEMQRRLHAIGAPSELHSVTADHGHPFGVEVGAVGLPDGDRLLHLDWHPLNLLVDVGAGEISGIIDWDNARRGHPLLDLARTHAILTVEPALASLPAEIRTQLKPLHDGWTDGYGPEATTIPPGCLAWAGRGMLADLEPRYANAPEVLEPLRRWTDDHARSARA